MRKITFGVVPTVSLSLRAQSIAGTDIVVSDEPRLLHLDRLSNKVTRNAWESIDIVLRGCCAGSDYCWAYQHPIQAIKLVREMASVGGGNLGQKESKHLVDEARAGRWNSNLQDVIVEVY